MRQRHAEFFTRLAEEARPVTSDKVRAALADDEANCRAALEYCSAGREPDLMLRLAGALSFFWVYRGQHEEGLRWLEEAVSVAGSTRSPFRARGLRGLAALVHATGDLGRARSLLEQALDLYRELGDDEGISRCLNNLGIYSWRAGNLERAEVYLQESLVIGQGLNELGVDSPPVPLWNLAELAFVRGDLPRARALADEALRAARKSENEGAARGAMVQLARLATREHRTTRRRG